MPFVDGFGQRKKHEAMKDTWEHMYPEPSSKWYGEIIIAIGEYGNQIIIKSDFPALGSSPQRYEIEHSIFNRYDLKSGIYLIRCGIWFYKTCHNMYRSEPIGKLINIQIEEI